MKSISNQSEFDSLLNQPKPILLDFYADWCGPCQTLLPTVDKLSKEYEGSVEIRKINVDENQMLAGQLRIQSIPTVYAFFNGQPIDGLT